MRNLDKVAEKMDGLWSGGKMRKPTEQSKQVQQSAAPALRQYNTQKGK